MADHDDDIIIQPTEFTRAEAGASRRGFEVKPATLAIAGVFLTLAIAALFMFMASAVRFSVSPEPDTFSISGGPSWQLGERYLMLPGSYQVTATLDGYHPLDTGVEIAREDDQLFELEMRKLPGILAVSTDPDVLAEVWVDQQLVGTTPLTIDTIEPGLHDINLISTRYQPYSTEVDIRGMRAQQEIVAELTPAWADITIDSRPGDAAILIDNDTVAQTPATIEILQGERQISLVKSGYKIWQSSIEVVAGEPQVLEPVALIRSDGSISIKSEPAGANVTIAGRFYGQTPLEVTLPPGNRYEMQLTRAGFEPASRAVDVRPEQDVALNVRLSPVLGSVTLLVEPADAQLFVDDDLVGNASRELKLTARPHTLRIEKPGFAPWTTTLTPQPGLNRQLMVELQTEAEAAIAAISDQQVTTLGLDLKLVLPGELKMGAGRREPGRRSNEIERDVVLTRPYYLSATEVTNEQFKLFAPQHDSGVLGRSVLTDPNRPVVNVSWQNAVAFCNWLSEKEGLPAAYENVGGQWQAVTPMNTGYRLPTEAEWAWAARYHDGEVTRFPWGNAMPPRQVHANYADESAANMVPYHIAGYNDAYRGPAPVGTFEANGLGIFDLAGNVSEWLHDFYSINLVREVETDPMGPAKGQYHVVRGSNYTHGRFSELRWTYRDYGDKARPDVGFRIARYVE